MNFQKEEKQLKQLRGIWFSDIFIAILFGFSFLIIPLILGVVLLRIKIKLQKSLNPFVDKALETEKNILAIKKEIEDEKSKNLNEIQSKAYDLEMKMKALDQREREVKIEVDSNENKIKELEIRIETLLAESIHAQEKTNSALNDQKREINKINKIKKLYKSISYSIKNYELLNLEDVHFLGEIIPTVELGLKSDDVPILRKEIKEVKKLIDDLMAKYLDRYTVKSNKVIYQLMVLGLSAELQNVLFNLKYTNLENSENAIKNIIKKYLELAAEGNQSIAPTLRKFIGEAEYLYLKAIETEYKYYVLKEQQKAEQAAIREQMKQEAEEKKQLELAKKQVEKEESKYITEIEKTQELLNNTQDDEKLKYLELKLLELQTQLNEVENKKDEIIKRQNGKAGYVYVISNLGSFGESTFKVGMTRRLDPMDRVKELGDASVPFTFDVHSFIFSDDAVSLEQVLHERLNENRLNKVNLKKEFFKTTVEDLEKLVNEIDPTAEFNKTMIAEEYRQSLTMQ